MSEGSRSAKGHRYGRRGDGELLAAVATGDHRAFAEFYRAHVDDVLGTAARRCRDPHEVAELCAAVFVAVWEGAAGFDAARGSAGAWLSGIATRRLADLRRSDARRLRLAERLSADALLTADDTERIAERIDAERRSGSVASALRRLPAEQRTAFERVAVDGAATDVVGDELGISPTAVRMRVMRARRTLRQQISPDAPFSQEST